MNYTLAGVAVVPLVLGIVEFMKDYGVTGRWSRLLAVVLGIIFGFGVYADAQGMIPEVVKPWVYATAFALSMGLAIPGLYDYSKRAVSWFRAS